MGLWVAAAKYKDFYSISDNRAAHVRLIWSVLTTSIWSIVVVSTVLVLKIQNSACGEKWLQSGSRVSLSHEVCHCCRIVRTVRIVTYGSCLRRRVLRRKQSSVVLASLRRMRWWQIFDYLLFSGRVYYAKAMHFPNMPPPAMSVEAWPFTFSRSFSHVSHSSLLVHVDRGCDSFHETPNNKQTLIQS